MRRRFKTKASEWASDDDDDDEECIYDLFVFLYPLFSSLSLSLSLSPSRLFSSFHLTQYYNVLVMFIKSVSHTQVWDDWNVLLSSKLLDNRLMLNSAQLNSEIITRHMHQKRKKVIKRNFWLTSRCSWHKKIMKFVSYFSCYCHKKFSFLFSNAMFFVGRSFAWLSNVERRGIDNLN